MSDKQESEDLVRVGPGTVMGEFMRNYWIPCAKSSELVAGGVPIRLPLLGEKLIAYRSPDGRVGVVDQRCPHRCASLFLGRNEPGGLRCVYHGWKFDTDGNCVDLPNVGNGEVLKHNIKAKAYKAEDRNGLIWVYMGKLAPPPPLPAIEPNLLPEQDTVIEFIHRDCNWLQSLEGDIDTSHFGFLHVGTLTPERLDETHPFYGTVVNRVPQYRVQDAPWGTSYGAYRKLPSGEFYWRTANFLFPFWTQIPTATIDKSVHARAWVPIDDYRTMFISVYAADIFLGGKPNFSLADGTVLDAGYRIGNNYIPNTTDWYGRWRVRENERNDWHIDREAQRTNQSFSGIENIHLQDQAVTESMGPITDHSWEHLTKADMMVGITRRRLLKAARQYAKEGEAPPGSVDSDIFLQARGGYCTTGTVDEWVPGYRHLRPA
jgi:phenylpropionate dioxygenase-like ring-hydroxylating dioxygenase large terminal subunit